MALQYIKGGKEDVKKDEKPKWAKDRENAKVKAMFESDNNFGNWSRNENGFMDESSKYPGKLGEAMKKYGSLKGLQRKKKDEE